MVSFAHRRRRTTSFKTRVSRSLIPRHSMRAGRSRTENNEEIDLELGENENIILANSEEIPSSSEQTTSNNQQGGPSRSPIFMLSMAQRGIFFAFFLFVLLAFFIFLFDFLKLIFRLLFF